MALRGAGYYPLLFGLIRSKFSSLCPQCFQLSKGLTVFLLRGSSEEQSYPECWLEVPSLVNYANFEARTSGGDY